MPFPTLTAPPIAPDRNLPDSFLARADAYVAWFATNNAEMASWTILANDLTGVTGTYQFTDGSSAAPAISFAADTNTGIRRRANDVVTVVTGGNDAAEFNASGDFYVGSPTSMAGIGAARISSQGTGASGGTWALGKFGGNAVGPAFAFAKSRGTALDSYTIINANDALGSIEFWGADGSTLILGAKIQGYNFGTPAANDVRAGVRIQTGSGAGGAVTTRLSIDDTSITATLPITTTGSIRSTGTGGVGYGVGSGGTISQATSKSNGVTLNKASGRITTNAAALAAGVSVEFTLTNSEIGIEDHVGVTVQSPVSKYTVSVVGTTAGTCIIRLTNYTGGSLSEAVLINFAVVKVAVS